MNRRAVDVVEAASPLPSPGPRAVLLAVAGAAAYVALDWVSYIHPMQQYGITPWNPQPAVAIALLMLGGQRWMPVVFAAVLASEWIVRGSPAWSGSTLLVAAVLALCYAAIARALTGRFSIHASLDSRRDVMKLVGVVSAGVLATGILYVAALLAGGIGPLDEPFLALARFWIGDVVGILVTLPVILMLAMPSRRAALVAMLRQRVRAAHAALTALALLVVFASPAEEETKLFYVLFLPLVLVSTRHGMAGACLATLLIQGAVIVAGEAAGYSALTFFELQALLIALTVTGLFLGVTVDERRHAEAELRGTLRLAAAGEMAAALAHELNQPLTAVGSYARACRLLADAAEPDHARLSQTLDKLLAESTRAGEVVRRLRDFFRTGSTRLEAVALRDVVARAVDAVHARATEAQVAIDNRVDASLPAALADRTQIELVFRNLLANAIEASAAGGRERRVRVEASADAERLAARVIDSGHGVKAADAERIFEPFETSRASGMGMGLAISRAIAEAHGGRLWVEPGDSGRFALELPRAGDGDG